MIGNPGNVYKSHLRHTNTFRRRENNNVHAVHGKAQFRVLTFQKEGCPVTSEKDDNIRYKKLVVDDTAVSLELVGFLCATYACSGKRQGKNASEILQAAFMNELRL